MLHDDRLTNKNLR